MKKFLIYMVLIVLIGALGIAFYSFYDRHILTRNFRSGDQRIVLSRMLEPKCISAYFTRNPDLKDLQIWGSAVPNFNDIDELVKRRKLSPDNVYIFDLTYTKLPYVDDHSLKWYGYRDLAEFFGTFEKTSFSRVVIAGAKAKYYEWKTGKKIKDLQKSDFLVEKEMALKRGFHYLEPLDSTWRDEWSFVDAVLPIFKSLPDDAWIYFHCAHGHGRTTTLMLVYDIFKSSRKVPLDDILERQYCIGGENIRNTEVWENGTWTATDLRSREKLVNYFYDYMHDENGYGKKSFVEWSKNKH